MTRASAVLIGAVVLALLIGHLLRGTPGYAVRQADGTLQGDIDHYVYWTRLVTLGGIQSAYSGTWPETYAVYPPVTLYPYQAIGVAYQALQDPTFDPEEAQTSLWLRAAIKAVALGWHTLTALAIFWLLRETAGPAMASASAAAYVLNPAALYDVGHWAQPDGAHSLFSVLAIGLLSLGQTALPGAAFALAALAKPQAWVLLPLLALATWRQGGRVGIARSALAGAAVGGIVVLPFVLSGRLSELLSLPGTISSVMPVVSADAHNLWWLVLEPRGIDTIVTPDASRALGLLTYRALAGTLVLAQLGLTYWLFWTRRASLAEAAALGVLGWFVFTTQAHENHLFFAVPLLALAWPARRSLRAAYAVLTLTLLLNMALHDQLVLESLGFGLDVPIVEQLRLANAGLNVACFIAWARAASLRHVPQRVERRGVGVGVHTRPTATLKSG